MPRPSLSCNKTLVTLFALWTTQQFVQNLLPAESAVLTPFMGPFVGFLGNVIPNMLQEAHTNPAQKADAILRNGYLTRAIGRTIRLLTEQLAAETSQPRHQKALRAFAETLPDAWVKLIETDEALASLAQLQDTEVTGILTGASGKDPEPAFLDADQWTEIVRALQEVKSLKSSLDDILLRSLGIHITQGFTHALRQALTEESGESAKAFARLTIDFFTDIKSNTDLLPGMRKDLSRAVEILEKGPPTRQLKTKCVITLNHYFTGRASELVQLREALQSGGTVGVTQAIAGLGGIGKSSLARAYANAHQAEYDAIFYLNASDTTSLNSSYREIDRQFEPPLPLDAPDETVSQTVQAYLNGSDRYLLLVDNADFGPRYSADDLKPFLPGSVRGHVLLTTRASAALDALEVAADRVITLHDMEPDDAATLLWERVKGKNKPIPPAQKGTLLAIARTLYFFPLALEQAAAYIAERKITHAEYLSDQAHGVVDLLEEQQANVGHWTRDEQYRRAVGTTWAKNMEALQQSGKEASVTLLYVSAFLAPEAIPLKEIADAYAQLSDRFDTDVFGRREQEKRRAGDYAGLLKPLLDYSLVSKDAEKGTFDVHRLLQEVIRHAMSEKEQGEGVADTVKLLNFAFPKPEPGNESVCERLTSHTLMVFTHARQRNYRTNEVARLLNDTAYCMQERGRFAEAMSLFNEALSIRRELLPYPHSDIAESLNNLAESHRAIGNYYKALALYKKALSIRRKLFHYPNPYTAVSLHGLAELYLTVAKHDKALPLYEEALEIARNSVPYAPLIEATVLNSLAEWYRNTGNNERALTLNIQALEIRRKNLPAKHRDIAQSLNNLSLVYKMQGDYPMAILSNKEALAIYRETLPANHVDIAKGAGNLANLYLIQEEYGKALPLYNEAISIDRTALPESHPDIAVDLHNLAKCYHKMGDYTQSMPLYEEAVAIMQVSWGETHPSTQYVINSALTLVRAKALHEWGSTEEAKNALPEEEKDVLLNEPESAFWALVDKFKERLT